MEVKSDQCQEWSDEYILIVAVSASKQKQALRHLGAHLIAYLPSTPTHKQQVPRIARDKCCSSLQQQRKIIVMEPHHLLLQGVGCKLPQLRIRCTTMPI